MDGSTRETATLSVHRDVPYVERSEGPLCLDVYEPVEATEAPAVVVVHGGAFQFGARGELSRYALDLAAEGYVVVDVAYRLAPAHRFPAALIDVKAAIEWTRTVGPEYGVDPERVGALGYSAGANLVALAAATADDPGFEPETYPGASSSLDAVVGFAGVYDLAASASEGNDVPETYLGVSPSEDPDRAELASPMVQAGADFPPTLLVHGRNDETVSPTQSERFAERLGPLTDVDLELLDSDHCFPLYGVEFETVFDHVASFFDGSLGPV
jgi:acetyl esterase/lipase